MAAPVVIAPPKLTKKKAAFVKAVVATGDDIEALAIAGYSTEGKAVKSRARKLRTELALHIDKELREYIKSTNRSIMAVHVIDKILEGGKTKPSKLHLDAARDTLTRGGHDEDKVIKIEKTIKDLSSGAVDTRIAQLLEELQGEYIPAEIVDEQEG